MNRLKKIKQAAKLLVSSLRNFQLYMLNFAKSKKFSGEQDLEIKSMNLKAIELKMEKISVFNFHHTV